MSTSPVISLRNVSKQFRRKGRSDHTMLSRLLHPMRIRLPNDLIALHDISFDVTEGEIIGIIGDNAAGKSTLLRVIAGILTPDSGTVTIAHPVTSIMNLGAGMRHQLTVRDNIYLACSLYGMTRTDTKAVFDDIVEFGELEQYVDMFTYQLSTGYNQRLAFSIAVHSMPKILLLDEVFSAGDKDFQQKALERMRALIRGDVTVMIVSHSLKRIAHLSDRVLWLDEGRLHRIGNPKELVETYESTAVA